MSAQPSQPQPGLKAEDSATEKLRISRAFWLSLYGLALAAALVMALLIAGWKTSSDIVAVVGLFTSVLGTLVGAFFGLQIGSAGKAEAEARATKAQNKVTALAGAATPDVIKEAKSHYKELFE